MGGFTTGEMPVFMMSLYCWVCYKLIVKSKQFNKVEQPALVYPSLTLIFNKRLLSTVVMEDALEKIKKKIAAVLATMIQLELTIETEELPEEESSKLEKDFVANKAMLKKLKGIKQKYESGMAQLQSVASNDVDSDDDEPLELINLKGMG